ncbi:MAG: alkaline phosphatase [Pirellulales bacterium]
MTRKKSQRTMRIALLFTAALLSSANTSAANDAVAEHVIVIGVDGLAPFGIQQANTPTFKRLCDKGASTMHARAVMPTSSSPNWASMIMGAGPEQHGVTSNDWERDKYDISPVVRGPEGIFPTMFAALRQSQPRSVIGVFHDWEGFGRLVEKKSCDAVEHADGPNDAIDRGIEFWRARQPTLLFIHLDHVDHAGHSAGWGSPAYLQAVEQADHLIARVLSSIEESKSAADTVLIVTADHGGINQGHGGSTMAELEIPWIACGAGIVEGVALTTPVNTFDTAPTVLRILGVDAPACWIGRPVAAAFK